MKMFAACEWLVCPCGTCRQKVKHIRAFWGTQARCANCFTKWHDWDIKEQIWVSTATWWKPLTWGNGYFENVNRGTSDGKATAV